MSVRGGESCREIGHFTKEGLTADDLLNSQPWSSVYHIAA
jgi:hypothetical protein